MDRAGEVTPRHGLGPHVVGHRVVVRRLLRGETGPSGGPAMTDLLGVCESWEDGRTTIRAEDGTLTTIALADIVSGKPVPPRPSRFARLGADEVERRAAALFVPREVEHVGDWLLRYAGGSNGRPNSILPVGDPGVPLDEALARAATFYAGHGRSSCAQVVVGSPVHAELEQRGWVRLRPDEDDTDVLLAGVARVARALAGTPEVPVRHEDRLTRAWLVGNDAALANYPAVEASLRLPDAVFASVHEGDRQVARARANLGGDWALLADLTVQPEHRRRGLARVVMADLVTWAAEQGAGTLLLQVIGDNAPAQALYAGLGFERHHAYRYLVPPAPVA